MANLSLDKKLFFTFLFFLVLGFSLYHNTFQNDFLFDDRKFFVGEENLGTISFKEIFTKGYQGFYRPLVISFLKVEHLFFHQNPWGYHIVDLVLFLVTAFLFLILLYKITSSFELSFLASSLYLVHPINSFLVNYKTASAISIQIIFLQLSALWFLKFLGQCKVRHFFLSLIFYFFALLSKESSFILPIHVLCILYFFRSSIKPLHNLSYCAAYAFPFFLFLFLRENFSEALKIIFLSKLDITIFQYVHTLSKLIFWYISKLIVPKSILFIWDEKIPQNPEIIWIMLFILLFLVAIVLVFQKRYNNVCAFGYVFFLIGFIPSALASFSYTLNTKRAIIEPHWFQFSSVGFFLIVAYFIYSLKRVGQNIWIIIFVMLVSGFAFCTYDSNRVWRNEEIYCDYWNSVSTLNGEALACKARAYIQKYDKGPNVRQYSNCAAMSNVAGAYHLSGNSVMGEEYYLKILKRYPSCWDGYYGLGVLYMDNAKHDAAERAFILAIHSNSELREAYERLIEVYMMQGETEKAQKVMSIGRHTP